MCKDVENIWSRRIYERNEYEYCNSADCTYSDVELCCSRNQICGQLDDNICESKHTGYINDPLSYNLECES